ncbi:MAG: hypothetical protein V3T83_13450 [Acidobacteriota bacterium]
MKKSRSQFYSEAVAEYVARHDPDTVTEQINAVCSEVDTRPDPFLTEAARRILAETESWSSIAAKAGRASLRVSAPPRETPSSAA